MSTHMSIRSGCQQASSRTQPEMEVAGVRRRLEQTLLALCALPSAAAERLQYRSGLHELVAPSVPSLFFPLVGSVAEGEPAEGTTEKCPRGQRVGRALRREASVVAE